MLEWVYELPLPQMALVIFGAVYLVAFGILAIVITLATRGRVRVFKGLAPGMLSPLGTIFGLFGGFLAVQVWNDSQRAMDAVNREASALRTVVILASSFPPSAERRLRALVRLQIQKAVTEEWPAMANRHMTILSVPAPLVEALDLTLADAPHGEGQVLAQKEMVRALRGAFEARRTRIIISESTVNGVKWACLAVEAILILVATAMVHSDNRATAAIAMAIFATAIAASMMLIASHAEPFTGAISVGPEALLEVIPEDR
jgi:hypothetical protein